MHIYTQLKPWDHNDNLDQAHYYDFVNANKKLQLSMFFLLNVELSEIISHECPYCLLSSSHAGLQLLRDPIQFQSQGFSHAVLSAWRISSSLDGWIYSISQCSDEISPFEWDPPLVFLFPQSPNPACPGIAYMLWFWNYLPLLLICLDYSRVWFLEIIWWEI